MSTANIVNTAALAVHTVPFFSAATVNAGLDLASAVNRVLASHWYVLGQEVAQFEKEFAAYVGVDHCISLANGTDALELGLRSVGVRRGDTVLLVANAGFYGSTAVHAIGAVPLYVDVDEQTLTLSATALAQALEAHANANAGMQAAPPKAVIATHLYGQLADIAALALLCKNAGIALVEDCAQSHGAASQGQRAGSWGDVACFSFYPTKNLGALGDGGAVVTRHEATAHAVRSLRQYGWSQKYTVAAPGGRNSRLDEIQAAILREKLPRLDAQNAQRRSIAARYNTAFAGLPLQCPASVADDYVAHLYVMRCSRRDALRSFLQAQQIATDIHYPVADHQQPAYPGATTHGALVVTEQACQTALSLPCFPGMADSDVAQVVGAVHTFFALPGA